MAAMALRTVTCSLPIPSTSTRSSKKPAKPITSTTPSSKKVLVPIGFGTEEMEAVILVDVLRRAGADVMLASVEKELQVEGSSGTKLVADVHIGDCARHVFDLVALPGGMPGSVRLRDCEILREITTKQAEGKRFYGAICAAPAVALLPWGLLKRKQVTCHPAFMDKLPSFRAVKSNLQVSGELTTSRGPGTAFEFALSFIEQLFGDNVADEVGGQLHIKNCGGHRKEEYNQVEWSFDRIPHVLVPIANGCEETEIVMLGDILRRAKVDVTLASVEKSKEIVASQQTKIIADKSIEEASDSAYDLVILPGGVTGAERLRKSKVLKQLLKKQKEDGRMYGAICSSLAILQKQGLLTGKTTTDSISAEAGVVIDGKLITGRGLGTVTDLSLAIISKLYGHGRARSVAEGLVFEYGKS